MFDAGLAELVIGLAELVPGLVIFDSAFDVVVVGLVLFDTGLFVLVLIAGLIVETAEFGDVAALFDITDLAVLADVCCCVTTLLSFL